MATSTQYFKQSWEGNVPTPQIDLAHESSFRLGAVLVEPSRLRLSRPGFKDLNIEPRIMQVLAALHEAYGRVVGRDDLIERCWAGRIVGENSINRVISLLRRASETIGKGSFEIETIPKVGYRLNTAGIAPANDSAMQSPLLAEDADGRRRMTRRRMIGGLAAAGVGGLAAAGATITVPTAVASLRDGSLALFGGHVPTPEARRLYDAGMQAQYFGLNALTEQAELYFRRAAQADPNWPDAWGALAMSYRHMMDLDNQTDQWRLVEQARAAANRALELDPYNADAIVALTLIRPPFGRWLETEREYALLLDRFPDSFVLRGHYGAVLRDLGRFREAAEQTGICAANHPLIPQVSVDHVYSLWGAGRLQEADGEMERAFSLFANCHALWFTRSALLTYTGRASEALGFALGRENWPPELPQFLFERRRLTAQAVLSRAPEDVAAVQRAIDDYVRRCLSWFPFAIDPWWPVPFLSYIGDLDGAFEILDSYYLWRGPLASPVQAAKTVLSRRDTSLLFMPTLANVRRDPRFSKLVDELGLTRQFRSSGKWPEAWRPGV